MEVTLSNDDRNIVSLLGISEERYNEIVEKTKLLADISGLADQKPSLENYQKMFDLLQSIAETPGEEVYLNIIFGDAITQIIKIRAFMKMRSDFIASQLPHN